MRLAHRDTQREPEPLLVGVVTPPELPATSGLEELFRDAYQRLHRKSLSYAERFLSQAEAEDALGDAALKVWRLWPHLRPEQRTDAYFMSAVRSKVRDVLEQSGRFVSLEDAESELDAVTVAMAARSARGDLKAEILDDALAAMPAKRREILLLIHEHRLSWREAAEELGVTLGTINQQMHRAGKQLRAAFMRAGFQIAGSAPARLPSPSEDATHD